MLLRASWRRPRRWATRYNTGPELEFFLFSRTSTARSAPLPHDQAGYFDLSTDLASDVRKDMVNALEEMGIKVETSHHEVATGQHEIDFEYGDALTTADNAVTFKYTLKAIAQQHGLHATFMPKPFYGINGSGMHIHQSLADARRRRQRLRRPERRLRALRRSPSTSSPASLPTRAACAPCWRRWSTRYKRLVPGYEAPVYVSWARINRSALIRVPAISRRQAPRRPASSCAAPIPSCNPYLAFAVMLAAGLDGIERDLPLPEPVEENLYHFDEDDLAKRQHRDPARLARRGARGDEARRVVRDALGDHVFERFLEAKRGVGRYRMHVSPWELERYLEEF